MPASAVLVCTADLVDGACPAEAQKWVASASLDPFALPDAEQLRSACDAAVTAFFIPTMIAMIVAVGVRWVLEQIS